MAAARLTIALNLLNTEAQQYARDRSQPERLYRALQAMVKTAAGVSDDVRRSWTSVTDEALGATHMQLILANEDRAESKRREMAKLSMEEAGDPAERWRQGQAVLALDVETLRSVRRVKDLLPDTEPSRLLRKNTLRKILCGACLPLRECAAVLPRVRDPEDSFAASESLKRHLSQVAASAPNTNAMLSAPTGYLEALGIEAADADVERLQLGMLVDVHTTTLDLAAHLVEGGPVLEEGSSHSEPSRQTEWLRGTLKACLVVAEAAQELATFLRDDARDGPRTEGAGGRGKRAAGEPGPPQAERSQRIVLKPDGRGVLLPARLADPASGKGAASVPPAGRASSSSAGTSTTDVADDDFLEGEPELRVSAGPAEPGARGRKVLARAKALLEESPAEDIATWKGMASSMFPDTVAHHLKQIVTTWQKRLRAFDGASTRLAHEVNEAPAESGWRAEYESALEALNQHRARVAQSLGGLADERLRLQLIKQYQRPHAAHWLELLKAEQLEVGPVRALRSDPPAGKRVFEVCLQPLPDHDGEPSRPAWLHIHTKRPIEPDQLRQAAPADIEAAHLKNDQQKNLGRNYLQEQQALGNVDLMIHRGPVSHEQLCLFLKKARLAQ